MLRTQPSLRRHARSYRKLHLEPLEHRSLLSASPAVSTLLGTLANPPPVITLQAIHEIADCWDFEGMVTDKSGAVTGLVVHFGGVLAKYHLTATVENNGTYSITEELHDLTGGTATAQTRDAAGMASNVAMTFVDSRNVAAQGTIAAFVQSSGVSGYAGAAEATIATVAGTSRYLGDGKAATDAALNSPQGVAVDSQGNLFIADTYNNVIREVNSFTGAITTVAGNGICGY